MRSFTNTLLLLATLLTIYPVVESEKSEKLSSVQLSTKWRPLLPVFKVSVKRIWIIFG